MLEKRNIKITVVNLPGTQTFAEDSIFSFVEADGCNLSIFKDNSFNIVHSNSVIEHVGDWEKMLLFAKETIRVGENFFIQTPNYWFPVEPHCMTPFFHWFPKPVRVWLVLNMNLGHWPKADNLDVAMRTVESARLLTRGMLKELFQDATIATERIFFFAKSYIAYKKCVSK
jgi:hypothetical protein